MSAAFLVEQRPGDRWRRRALHPRWRLISYRSAVTEPGLGLPNVQRRHVRRDQREYLLDELLEYLHPNR